MEKYKPEKRFTSQKLEIEKDDEPVVVNWGEDSTAPSNEPVTVKWPNKDVVSEEQILETKGKIAEMMKKETEVAPSTPELVVDTRPGEPVTVKWPNKDMASVEDIFKVGQRIGQIEKEERLEKKEELEKQKKDQSAWGRFKKFFFGE